MLATWRSAPAPTSPPAQTTPTAGAESWWTPAGCPMITTPSCTTAWARQYSHTLFNSSNSDPFSFAIDSSIPVMVPLNTSVTSTGNYVLSDLDVAKINCAYMCEAQGGPCGGCVEVRAQPLQVPVSGEAADCRWAVHAYGDQEDDDHQQYGLQIVILEVETGVFIITLISKLFALAS